MHDEFEDLLLAYTTRSLAAAEAARFEEHLEQCPACREALAEWQVIAEATRQVARQGPVTLPILNLEALTAKEQAMNTYPLKPMRRDRPLTLVYLLAALLAITGAVVISQFPSLNPSIIQSAQASPSPAVYVEVVIARQPIELGKVIAPDDVLLYRLPESTVPFDAVTEIEAVTGKISRTDIACGQPLLTSMIVDNARDIFQQGISAELNLGCAGLDFSPLSESSTLGALVIAVQDVPEDTVLSADKVTLRPYPAQLIPPDTFQNIDEVLDRMSHIHILREQAVLRRTIGQVIPSGTVAVQLSLENVQSDIAGLQSGNRIDVIVGMLYVPVNESLQTLQANGEFLGADDEQEPTLMLQRIVSGGQILSIVEAEALITLVVDPREAAVLTWAVEARLPFLLARAE